VAGHQFLGHVGVKLQLDEGHRTAHPQPIGEKQQVIEFFDEQRQRGEVAMVEPPQRRVPFQPSNQPVGIIETRLPPAVGLAQQHRRPVISRRPDPAHHLAAGHQAMIATVADHIPADIGNSSIYVVGALDQSLQAFEQRRRRPRPGHSQLSPSHSGR
jgi:hypothetical protein